MQLLFAVLLGTTGPVFASPSVEITHVQHQISETLDRLLVAEDRVDDEDRALTKDKQILDSLRALGTVAGGTRKIKEAQFIVDTHVKKKLEWEAIASIERAQLNVWKLQLDRLKGVAIADNSIEESYRALWNHRATHFGRMRDTWLVKHAYELEQYQALAPLARSGAISERTLLESDFRVKEAFHEAELSRRRSESAEKFPR